ncbi:MAG TPA: helix-turn-helix transcriptional regulator, partial [Gemmatimonadaceae bacterium]|nr:helix-turn-helix transcriptional regulator [Gemmatimonadaceae bacterium]
MATLPKIGAGAYAALSPDCSLGCSSLVDSVLFQTAQVAVGAFRCPIAYPSFRDTGPIERHIVVFPRTGVWIRHAGGRPFLADPSVVTIYNAAQRYERFPESPDGDRCDWFGVSIQVARDIARSFDEGAGDSEVPFRFAVAPSAASLYARQRRLLRRVQNDVVDPLEAEEEVMGIVASSLGRAYEHLASPRARRPAAMARRRDLAEATRAELLRTVRENRSVHDIARAVGSSPYHTCRVFHADTGRTLHAYRGELRIRLALERLEHPTEGANLSALAHDLGFSSHSHFVQAMRRHLGVTPSTIRTELLRAAPPRPAS